MQNEQLYNNYFDTPQYPAPLSGSRSDNCASTSTQNNSFRTSPQSVRAQTSFEVRSTNTHWPFEQTHERSAISPSRRSVHVDGHRLINQFSSEFALKSQLNNFACDPSSQRSTYRAPLLKANGRSLSARDSQERFEAEKMSGQQVCATKRLLPITPPRAVSPQRAYIQNRNSRLSVDAGIGSGLEILEHRLQNQLIINETLFAKSNKDKSTPERFTKRSQSPNVTDQRVDSTSPTNLSPKRPIETAQKQLLQGCQRRLNFQRSNQKSFMGQEVSKPAGKSSFSSSFDSSTVHCRSNVALANTRADSTASDDGAHDMHLNTVKTPHANSTGSLQVDSSNQTNKQKRSMNDLYSNPKPLRSNNTLAPISKNNKVTNGRVAKKSSQAGISSSSQSIINFCVENAKGDIATRVINRMVNKREDFNMFISNLSTKQYSEFTNSLREYFNLVVQNLQSTDKICEISANYGVEQVPRRTWGFKADFFAVMANALTTECVFLDGAAHQPTQAIEAWAELIQIMFENIREGYYQRIRYLRKNSHCFNSMFSQSGDMSNEDTTPASTPKPTETQFN